MQNKIKKINSIDGIDYYLYKPSIFRQYFDCYEMCDAPHYFSRPTHRIRMLILKILGNYRIYYLYSDSKVLGHIVVSNGGNRIAMSNKDDIVLGPIWICPNERGKGIGTKGIGTVLNNLETCYSNAYEYIEEDNIASQIIAKRNGYSLICRGKEYGLLKEIRENSKGNLLIYKYTKRV